MQCLKGIRLGVSVTGLWSAVCCDPPREGKGAASDLSGWVSVWKVLTLIHKAEWSYSNCEVNHIDSSGEEGSSLQHLGAGLVLSARPWCHQELAWHSQI